MEAAGVVADLGTDVEHLAVGDRVVYVSATTGAYAGWRTMPAASVVRLPRDIADRTAAGIFLKGIMADILARDVHTAKAGEVALVRAAAGGVGLLLSAMLRSTGASVIGAVSREEKAAAARRAGCDHVVVGSGPELARSVGLLTGGRGVDVVFDGLGRETFEQSLALLARRGHLVSFGQTTGPVGELNVDRLAAKSVRLSRPNIGHYLGDNEEIETRAGRLFSSVRSGALEATLGATFPLREAREAHRALEARRTVGALVLLPQP
jgi:NADPH:quinone reductase